MHHCSARSPWLETASCASMRRFSHGPLDWKPNLHVHCFWAFGVPSGVDWARLKNNHTTFSCTSKRWRGDSVRTMLAHRWWHKTTSTSWPRYMFAKHTKKKENLETRLRRVRNRKMHYGGDIETHLHRSMYIDSDGHLRCELLLKILWHNYIHFRSSCWPSYRKCRMTAF